MQIYLISIFVWYESEKENGPYGLQLYEKYLTFELHCSSEDHGPIV